jgi:meso-butanediol dehydrogenase / (S,S)-butanediol dehydrogenase / diacetyl reductase
VDKRFGGMAVLITGAGSGIGAATARRFAQEGAALALTDKDDGKLQAMAAALGSSEVLTFVADVSQQSSVEALVAATIQRFGKLHVLVNNAGVAVQAPFLEAKVEDWQKIFATDVDGVFYLCRAAVPHLLKTKGCIVNVSSVSGMGGDWGQSAYTAAKGAVTNFTRSLALELGELGVRVNAVNPGLTFTEMTKEMKKDETLMAKYRDRIPMGRGAEPEEVASAIAFLASADASYVNGVNLPVDGGVSASNGQPKVA